MGRRRLLRVCRRRRAGATAGGTAVRLAAGLDGRADSGRGDGGSRVAARSPPSVGAWWPARRLWWGDHRRVARGGHLTLHHEPPRCRGVSHTAGGRQWHLLVARQKTLDALGIGGRRPYHHHVFWGDREAEG